MNVRWRMNIIHIIIKPILHNARIIVMVARTMTTTIPEIRPPDIR